MVAINYAVMAADLAIEGVHGRLVALRNGTTSTCRSRCWDRA